MPCPLILTLLLATAPSPGEDTAGGESFVQDWWYAEVGGRGPTGWEATYDDCGGSDQSPVDVRAVFTEENGDLHALELNYPEEYRGYSTFHRQNVVGMRFASESGGYVGANYPKNANYKVDEILFRTPAEHLMSGIRHELEIQIVHVEEGSEEKVVVCILYEEGGGRLEWLDKILKEIPHAPIGGFAYYDHPTDPHTEAVKNIVQEEFSIQEIYPGRRDYFTYTGGASAPPCSRNATHFIMKETGRVSSLQLTKLRDDVLQITAERDYLTAAGHTAAAEAYLGNVRPVQPLAGRTIYSYTDIITKIDHTDLNSLRLPTIGAIIGIATFIGVLFNLITIAAA